MWKYRLGEVVHCDWKIQYRRKERQRLCWTHKNLRKESALKWSVFCKGNKAVIFHSLGTLCLGYRETVTDIERSLTFSWWYNPKMKQFQKNELHHVWRFLIQHFESFSHFALSKRNWVKMNIKGKFEINFRVDEALPHFPSPPSSEHAFTGKQEWSLNQSVSPNSSPRSLCRLHWPSTGQWEWL